MGHVQNSKILHHLVWNDPIWNGFKENLHPTSTIPNRGSRGIVARVSNMAVCD